MQSTMVSALICSESSVTHLFRIQRLCYCFFAVFCLLPLVWTFFFLPEASERTLEQMGHLFRDSTSKAEEARRHAIESQLLRGRGLLD